MKRYDESQQLAADVEYNLRDFLYWPTKHHYACGTLWCLAASLYDSNGDFMPYAIGRPLFISELGDTGKSLSTDIMCAMVPGGEPILNPTAPGMQMVLNEGGCPGVHEFDKKVGIRAARNQEFMTVILGGYTKNAKVIQQRSDKSDRVNVSGPMILNGNNANMILHHVNYNPLRTRSHLYLMEPCPEDVYLTDFMPEIHDERLAEMRSRLRKWGQNNWAKVIEKPIDDLNIHPKIRNRQKQIWIILYRVAHFLGGEWPDRCEAAAKAMVLGLYENDDEPVISSTEEMLWAVRATFRDEDEWLSTDEILDRLCRLPQQPKLIQEWTSYRASTMGLAKVLRVFGIEHVRHSDNGDREWGYKQVDLYEDGEVPIIQ